MRLVASENTVDTVDVAERGTLATMQKWRRRVVESLSTVELENDATMLFVRALETLLLPPLSLVTAEIEDIESAIRLVSVV